MTGPLAAALAAVMATTALYCAGRLVAAPLLGRNSERGVDLLHVVMGSVMAATLLGVLGRRWDVVWVVGFAAAAFWYLRKGLVQRSRHSLQHGIGSVAMLAMVTTGSTSYAGGATQVALPGMAGMPGMGSGQVGALAPSSLLLAVLAVGVLALTAADTVQVVQVGRSTSASSAGSGSGSGSGSDHGPARSLAPRCAAGCRLTMGVAMAVALLAMV